MPVYPKYAKPKPSKPELFVVADISGSVSTFAAFTLQLVFALRSQFAKVRTFVFVDGVDEVTELLRKADNIIEVTQEINAEGKGVWLDGRSDYGHAFESFWDQWGEQVRRRTSVIILGDARTNCADTARAFQNVLITFVIDVKVSGPRDHGFMSVCSLLPSQAACQT